MDSFHFFPKRTVGFVQLSPLSLLKYTVTGSVRPVLSASIPLFISQSAGLTPRNPIDMGLDQVLPSSVDQLLNITLLSPLRITTNRRPSFSRIILGSVKPSLIFSPLS